MSKFKRLASGVSWGAASTIATTCFQLIFMAIMARLLDPANFGLIAIANVSLRFFSYFAQMGAAPALIQKPELEEGDVVAALSVSMSVAAVFFMLALVSAPFFEMFFDMAGLTLVIRVLALNFLISGFSAIAVGLLQRSTAFRALAIIDVISYVCGYGVVGIAAGYNGWQVWALVAAFLTQMTITAVLSYAVVRFPLSFRHASARRRHFLNYGRRYSMIGFAEFLSLNLDALAIGKLFGQVQSGLYNRAALLANLPVQQPVYIFTKALFPIMSSVEDHDKHMFGLQISWLLAGGYAFAVSAGVYFAAGDIVATLLGGKWLESIPILQTLCWAVGPAFISHVAGVTFDSLNRLREKLVIQLSMVFLLVLLVLFASRSGKVLDIAWAVVILEWLRCGIMVIKLKQVLRIPIRQIVIIFLSITILAASAGSLVFLTVEFSGSYFDKIPRLCMEILAGAGGLILGFMISRYLVYRLPAIQFLLQEAPIAAKFFP